MKDLISRHGVSTWLDNMGYPRLAYTVMDEDRFPPAQQWIPCSERMPSKADHTDDMVLVCYRNGSVRFNTYMNGWAQGNPVAWMPLPEPYGEEDYDHT